MGRRAERRGLPLYYKTSVIFASVLLAIATIFGLLSYQRAIANQYIAMLVFASFALLLAYGAIQLVRLAILKLER